MCGDCAGACTAETNDEGDGRSTLRDHFDGVDSRSLGRGASAACLPATPCTRSRIATRVLINLNKSSTVGKSRIVSDSNNVRHDDERHRDASENKIKSPKSGTCKAARTEIPSPNTDINLFKSDRVSTDDTGTCDNLSTNDPATKRGLS